MKKLLLTLMALPLAISAFANLEKTLPKIDYYTTPTELCAQPNYCTKSQKELLGEIEKLSQKYKIRTAYYKWEGKDSIHFKYSATIEKYLFQIEKNAEVDICDVIGLYESLKCSGKTLNKEKFLKFLESEFKREKNLQ